MSEVQAPVSQEREITIYATRGGQMKKIITNAKTWGELQPLVRREGFDLDSLLAAENINKTDLVNDLAILPSSAFRLFLRPKQTKSGALDRKDCFIVIKSFLSIYPEEKSKFIIDGKNITQLSTPVLQELVERHCNMPENNTSSSEMTDEERVDEALRLISPLSNYNSFEKAHKHLIRLTAEICMENSSNPETESLAREADNLLAGY